MKSLIKTDRESILKIAKPIALNPISIRRLIEPYSNKSTERVLVPDFALNGGLSRAWDNGKNINPANLNVGDVLYVQEEWASSTRQEEMLVAKEHTIYKLSEFENPLVDWNPSETMTAERARLFLFVYRIESEHLQKINSQGRHDDILYEGYPFEQDLKLPPIEAFKNYWNEQLDESERTLGNWDVNPFVWVLSFVKIELVDFNPTNESE